MNVSEENTAISQTLESIHILEDRLQNVTTQKRSDDDIEVFSDKTICLYYYLLGCAYYKLVHLNQNVSKSARDEWGSKSLLALESSVLASSSCLEIIDCQRLLSVHAYCNALCKISRKFKTAKILAEKTFEAANMHTNAIDEQSIGLMQRLRDDFMTYIPGQLGTASDGAQPEEELDEEGIAKLTSDKKKNTKKVTIEDLRPKDVGSNRGAELVRRMKRIVSIPVPVQLETIPSASLLLKALDRIFRAYVRGNALPGQLTGGATVDLDGRAMSFRNFILHGPYMSWRGFICFLFDFAIAKPPLPHTRSGKNYLSAMNSGSKGNSAAMDLTGPEPPLELKEAAAIFIEASHSATPALLLSKYLTLYAEIAENLDYEPWNVVTEWASDRSSNEWHITAGINFMQFVDCLGKLGAVAYSSTRFADMLPTFADKIEHFLSAYLGLSDERRWKNKVDNKLKKMKGVIHELREKLKAEIEKSAGTPKAGPIGTPKLKHTPKAATPKANNVSNTPKSLGGSAQKSNGI